MVTITQLKEYENYITIGLPSEELQKEKLSLHCK
jgi:hypothetical protein